MATEQVSKDEAAKERIIKHMNADHQDSLIRYLEHFCRLSSYSARHAKLDGVALDSLSISTSNGKKFRVPLQPPMETWAEAGPRFAALDGEAVEGLGRSNITVKRYSRPTGFLMVVFVTCILTITCFSSRFNFQPGSYLYDCLLRHVQPFARFCHTIQPVLFNTIIMLHAGEAVYMEQTRLKKHTIPRLGSLWWKWIISTFIEGKGAFIRFDRVIKEEEEKKAKAKH